MSTTHPQMVVVIDPAKLNSGVPQGPQLVWQHEPQVLQQKQRKCCNCRKEMVGKFCIAFLMYLAALTIGVSYKIYYTYDIIDKDLNSKPPAAATTSLPPIDLDVDLENVTCECGVILTQAAAQSVVSQQQKVSDRPRVVQNIVGGVTATVNSIPWQVGIKVSKKFPWCGGTIIGPTTILTAAHCLQNLSPTSDVTVLIGEHDLRVATESNSMAFKAASIIIHKGYEPDSTNYDFAIVRTSQVIQFSHIANAACVATNLEEDYVGSYLVVSGWGVDNELEDSASPILKKATVVGIDNSVCCDQLFGWIYCLSYDLVTSQMMCAGVSAGGTGHCFGDSGGPLTFSNGTHVNLVGITSFVSASGCAEPNTPGGFARVSAQLDWILEHGDSYVKDCSVK